MIGVCALLLAFAISGSATSVPYKVAKVSAEATKTTNWYLQPPPSQYSLLAPEFEVDQNSKATLIPQQAKWQAGHLTFICGVSISVYGALSLWFSRQAQESQRLLDIEIGSVWSMAAESGAVDVSKSEPATVESLKKKLLVARMMQKSKSKEYKPHEVCQDRKEIARLLTVQRQEELQAQGIDPFSKGHSKQKLWEASKKASTSKLTQEKA